MSVIFGRWKGKIKLPADFGLRGVFTPNSGGGSGIRTHDEVAPITVLKSVAVRTDTSLWSSTVARNLACESVNEKPPHSRGLFLFLRHPPSGRHRGAGTGDGGGVVKESGPSV